MNPRAMALGWYEIGRWPEVRLIDDAPVEIATVHDFDGAGSAHDVARPALPANP
jgi:hypothetical protein